MNAVRVALGVLLACFAVAGPASATVGHRYSSQFGSGQLAGPAGIAVDGSSGSMFVADSFAGVVDEFSLAGAFLGQWGGDATPAGFFNFPSQVATDGSTVYVDDTFNNAVDRFDTAGAYVGQLDGASTTAGSFSSPQGVAVDPVNGDVYVSNTDFGVIARFDSAGVFVEEIGAGELAGPMQLAVDSNQDLYVVDSGNGRVVKYTAGSLVATVSTNGPNSVAVNPADDHVFVSENGPSGPQVSEYLPDGTLVSSFGSGQLAAPAGIGVDPATGRVYVSDQGAAAVLAFNEVLLPTVATTPGATGVSASGATVAGTVNPEGVAGTTYHFEWGADQSYGNITSPDQSAGNGSADVPASATLSGLAPGTTYHFRVVATNPQGSIEGADQSFTTDPAQVSVDGQPAFASAMTPTGATLNGTVNPNGAQTSFHFEYGTDTTYGTSTPDGDAGSTTGDTLVMADLTGLQPGTVYHARVVADNGIGGPVQGADFTFSTAPATPPTADQLAANGARLNGTVNPQGSAGTYHFEYGPDTTYGTSTPEANAGPGSADVAVSRTVTGLAADTTYHFRVVATVNGQTVTSDDATFTTLSSPEITTGDITGLTTTTATVGATVDTHGETGTLTVYVTSQTSPYTTNATLDLAAADGPRDVTVALTGLPAGGDYTALPTLTAAGATVYGDQATFSTPANPTLLPPAPPNISSNPYGCTTPHLDAVDTHPRAGRSVTVTGQDLGIAGTIALGDALVNPASWTPTAITFIVPTGTTGTKPLTVNCGKPSNTVGLAVAKTPSNRFVLSAKTVFKGATATLKVRVPGPGKLRVGGRKIVSTQKTITRKSTARVVVRLTRAAKRSTAKRLTTAVRIRFIPAGGKARTKTRTITFNRSGAR
jgi:DNA-binding beta-propeller fold protein YncE